jgi:hypothetical protein
MITRSRLIVVLCAVLLCIGCSDQRARDAELEAANARAKAAEAEAARLKAEAENRRLRQQLAKGEVPAGNGHKIDGAPSSGADTVQGKAPQGGKETEKRPVKDERNLVGVWENVIEGPRNPGRPPFKQVGTLELNADGRFREYTQLKDAPRPVPADKILISSGKWTYEGNLLTLERDRSEATGSLFLQKTSLISVEWLDNNRLIAQSGANNRTWTRVGRE